MWNEQKNDADKRIWLSTLNIFLSYVINAKYAMSDCELIAILTGLGMEYTLTRVLFKLVPAQDAVQQMIDHVN